MKTYKATFTVIKNGERVIYQGRTFKGESIKDVRAQINNNYEVVNIAGVMPA